MHDVLDVACGPGGWVLSVAGAFQAIEVTGIDISERMITYAATHAKARGLSNTHFRVMNALETLNFPDNSFDLVNARIIVGFMLPSRWPTFLQECKRILRPGGLIRLSEVEWGFTNKEAVDTLSGICIHALQLAGQSFSSTGRTMGIITVLRHLLQQAGFEQLHESAQVVNYSAGTEQFEGNYQNLLMIFQMMQPFLLKIGIITKEKFDALYQQAAVEMLAEDYCAISIGLTVLGHKPS